MIRIIVEIYSNQFDEISKAMEETLKPYDVKVFRAEEVTKTWQIREV